MPDMTTTQMEKTPLTTECAVGAPCPTTNARPAATDIHETAEELVLVMDLPGVRPDGLDVKFEDGTLSVHGAVESRSPEGARSLWGGNRPTHWFRSFRIEQLVKTDEVAADLKNGVLTVRLPKADAVRPRRIPVRAGA